MGFPIAAASLPLFYFQHGKFQSAFFGKIAQLHATASDADALGVRRLAAAFLPSQTGNTHALVQ